jgi:hypothetical protein
MKSKYLAFLLAMAVTGCVDHADNPTGGTSTTTPAGTTFPLQKGIGNLQAAGFTSQTLTVSGTATTNGTQSPATGSLIVSETAVGGTGLTFGGEAAVSKTVAIQGNLFTNNNGGNPVQDTSTLYFAATGLDWIGETTPTEYCVVTKLDQFPAMVSAGQTGPFATLNCYTDSTMDIPAGTIMSSYAISPGLTSSTVTYTKTDTVLDTTGAQVAQQQISFGLDVSGNITFQSVALNQTINGVAYDVTAK